MRKTAHILADTIAAKEDGEAAAADKKTFYENISKTFLCGKQPCELTDSHNITTIVGDCPSVFVYIYQCGSQEPPRMGLCIP